MSEENKTNEPMLQLPDDWKERAISILNDKIQNAGVCPRCNQNGVSISDDVVSPVRLESNAFQLGGLVYPQVMLICHTCGHTSYFNLVTLGVTSLASEDGDENG